MGMDTSVSLFQLPPERHDWEECNATVTGLRHPHSFCWFWLRHNLTTTQHTQYTIGRFEQRSKLSQAEYDCFGVLCAFSTIHDPDWSNTAAVYDSQYQIWFTHQFFGHRRKRTLRVLIAWRPVLCCPILSHVFVVRRKKDLNTANTHIDVAAQLLQPQLVRWWLGMLKCFPQANWKDWRRDQECAIDLL